MANDLNTRMARFVRKITRLPPMAGPTLGIFASKVDSNPLGFGSNRFSLTKVPSFAFNVTDKLFTIRAS